MKVSRIIIISLVCISTISRSFAAIDTLSYEQGRNSHNWFYLGTGENIQPLRKMTIKSQVAVIGGGMSGIAAAVAAARQGAEVLLVNDRPVLGGNASSEIRVTVNSPRFERNSGIADEILIANRKYNPQESYHTWDHVLLNYVLEEPNITLALNTSAMFANSRKGKIESVVCWQSTTETEVTIEADIFIDCTGDGSVGASAGAEYRTGREGKEEFGETYAPDKPDGWVMGEAIMMVTRDMGRTIPFYPPANAKKYTPKGGDNEGDRRISTLKEGYWWIELGSDYDIIADRPHNSVELLSYIYGVWDYVKNSGKYPEAANLAIEWIGSLPGKRESRRLVGDYMLSESDLVNYREFTDAVAWGGWSLDEHAPGGILNEDAPASYFHAKFDRPYQIPYRCIYSKNIDNLLFAGRDISATHIALSSTRIIETCMSVGQAAGVAAAMCTEYDVEPRDIYENSINELQERLLRADYYIPYRPATDLDNLAKKAITTASSTKSGDVKNLFDGVARDEGGENHHWMSRGTEAVLHLKWDNSVSLSKVELKFDTNVKRPMMMHKNLSRNISQVVGVPPELVKSFTVEAMQNGRWVEVAKIEDNIRRYVPLTFESINTSEIRISLHDTYGANDIKVFELRCY